MSTTSTPPDPVTEARRAVLQHRRRRYPDRAACGFCGGKWQIGHTAAGTPMAGCEPRRQAIVILDQAGQLDADGHLVPYQDGAR
jgi:hypothetical protein